MSLFRPVTLACPNCDASITVEAVGSINADRRPDYRDAILADNFQDMTCEHCGTEFRLQPTFNYLDAGRGQWIAAMPGSRMPDYLTAEEEVNALFAVSYGNKAPQAAQAVGENLSVRLTFGWPAVREKLLLRENDLDDAVVELMKLDILRNVDKAPLQPGVELRIVGVTPTAFSATWLRTDTEEPLSALTVSREMYEMIVEHAEAWAPTRARLETGPFVDMQKLYMGPGRAATQAAE